MPIGAPPSSGMLGIILLVHNVVVKEPRGLGASVGNQRLVLGHFQLEYVSQELSQLVLNLLRFRLWTRKPRSVSSAYRM